MLSRPRRLACREAVARGRKPSAIERSEPEGVPGPAKRLHAILEGFRDTLCHNPEWSHCYRECLSFTWRLLQRVGSLLQRVSPSCYRDTETQRYRDTEKQRPRNDRY